MVEKVATQLFKDKNRQANKLSSSNSIIYICEREEIKPSIDVASKLANVLEVSLDYLLGKSDKIILDKKNIKRLHDIEELPEEDKKTYILYDR